MLVDILWQPMKQTAVRICPSPCLSVYRSLCLSASQPASMVVGCRSVCQLVHWPVAKSTKSTRTALTTKDVAPQRITFLLSLAPSLILFLSLSPPLSDWQNNAALNCRIIASKNCKYAYACQCQCKLIHNALRSPVEPA